MIPGRRRGMPAGRTWRERQKAAPQPDRVGAVGAKPMDFMRRSSAVRNTGAMKGNLNMGSFGAQPNFQMAGAAPVPTAPTWKGYQPKFPQYQPPQMGTGDAVPDISNPPKLKPQNIKTPYQGGPQKQPNQNQNRMGPMAQKQQDIQNWFLGKGIPLTPEFEEGMRQIEDNFSRVMAELGLQRAEIQGMIEMTKARTMTDFDQAVSSEEEGLASRGVGGGVAATAQNDLNTTLTRNLQDQWSQGHGALQGLRAAEGELTLGTWNAIQELLGERARSAVETGSRGASRVRHRG